MYERETKEKDCVHTSFTSTKSCLSTLLISLGGPDIVTSSSSSELSKCPLRGSNFGSLSISIKGPVDDNISSGFSTGKVVGSSSELGCDKESVLLIKGSTIIGGFKGGMRGPEWLSSSSLLKESDNCCWTDDGTFVSCSFFFTNFLNEKGLSSPCPNKRHQTARLIARSFSSYLLLLQPLEMVTPRPPSY